MSRNNNRRFPRYCQKDTGEKIHFPSLAAIFDIRRKVAWLFRSRVVWRAIQTAGLISIASSLGTNSSTANRRDGLRFPMLRSAQLTAFLTKLRLSSAPDRISGRNSRKLSSVADLSRHASTAIDAYAARFSNSASLTAQSFIFARIYLLSPNRFMQT